MANNTVTNTVSIADAINASGNTNKNRVESRINVANAPNAPNATNAPDAPNTATTPSMAYSEPPTPSSAWPAWMQRAMMEDGRVMFKGSKIGIKIGKLRSNSHTLGEMIKIVHKCQETLTYEQINFNKSPTSAALRKDFVCIGFAKSEDGCSVDREFAAILYNNGWAEYWSIDRHATLRLVDCSEFTYEYNYAINDIDKTVIDKSVLENENWVMCVCLAGEERITKNLNRSNTTVSNDENSEDADSAGNTANAGNAGEAIDADKKRQKAEPVTVVKIPNPEERILAQERHKEIQSIISAARSSLTDKQGEVFKLHFDYGIPLLEVSKMLGISPNTCIHRLEGIQEKFSKQITRIAGEDVEKYLRLSYMQTDTESANENSHDSDDEAEAEAEAEE